MYVCCRISGHTNKFLVLFPVLAALVVLGDNSSFLCLWLLLLVWGRSLQYYIIFVF